jgi:hypothetical protein
MGYASDKGLVVAVVLIAVCLNCSKNCSPTPGVVWLLFRNKCFDLPFSFLVLLFHAVDNVGTALVLMLVHWVQCS